MNFEERVDLRAVRWLLTQFNEDFVKANVPIEEQERFKYQFGTIKKTLLQYEKKAGINKTQYIKKDSNNVLRDYASMSIQGMPTFFRGLICKGMTDIDMVNCHPVIIWQLCEKHNIECKYLKEYCLNRKQLIDEGKANKTEVIASINKHTSLKKTTPFMSALDTEVKNIQQCFMKQDCFSFLLKMAQDACALKKDYKKHNIAGTFMSYVATSYEVKFLYSMINFLRDNKIEIGVLMYDGLMTYESISEQMLSDMSQRIKQEYEFDIQLKIKPLETGNLFIPSDWVESKTKNNYDIMKHKYETDYGLAYITKPNLFIYKKDDILMYMTKEHLKMELMPISCGDKSFIDLWIKDSDRQVYTDIDIYAHDRICNPNIYNLWTPFYAETCSNICEDHSRLLEHFNIMFNHDVSIINSVFDWISNMLQYPSTPSILLNFYTQVGGTGKGTIVDIIKALVGAEEKYQYVYNLENQLFGRFNGHLQGKVLIHLDELSAKDLNPYYSKLKAIITNSTFDIEGKGQKTITLQNMFHIVSTTQYEHAFKIKEGDRRIITIECSSVLKGDYKYFEKIQEDIKNPNIIHSLYNFFMSRSVKQFLRYEDFPETKLMKDTKELYVDPIEDFLDELNDKEYSSIDLYSLYRKYMERTCMEFKDSPRVFSNKLIKLCDKYNIKRWKNDMLCIDDEGNKYRDRRIMYKKEINEVPPQVEGDA